MGSGAQLGPHIQTSSPQTFSSRPVTRRNASR
ncbi:hypothetical protein ACVILH_001676 [Bradyrhizobium sp. USDA 4353]